MTDLVDRPASLGAQLRRRKPIDLARSGHGGELERSFGTFQLMMFGVGATVGTGIFHRLAVADQLLRCLLQNGVNGLRLIVFTTNELCATCVTNAFLL